LTGGQGGGQYIGGQGGGQHIGGQDGGQHIGGLNLLDMTKVEKATGDLVSQLYNDTSETKEEHGQEKQNMHLPEWTSVPADQNEATRLTEHTASGHHVADQTWRQKQNTTWLNGHHVADQTRQQEQQTTWLAGHHVAIQTNLVPKINTRRRRQVTNQTGTGSQKTV
jgi:hypothetical protein